MALAENGSGDNGSAVLCYHISHLESMHMYTVFYYLLQSVLVVNYMCKIKAGIDLQ